ncbi:methyltransferase type 11 [Rhodococcus pyridinivorans AK37]|uniref:Methyltransferase type 11 n=2 Tax=Rhodococcus pyridinivorans TaxID=103816 RepID=H0JM44_9NOCA|nr:methyltransferase type 11 [Rhodococcus pyridinivorans AK37]
MAEVLDLDAAMNRPYFESLLDRVAGQLEREPRTVVDIGAGTGTGTLALARRFPHAQLVALDRSAGMLERLRKTAAYNGFGDRIRTVEADLDAGLPAVGAIDLAWAALSLHHIEDPDATLRQLAEAMAPGGRWSSPRWSRNHDSCPTTSVSVHRASKRDVTRPRRPEGGTGGPTGATTCVAPGSGWSRCAATNSVPTSTTPHADTPTRC